MSLYAAIGYVVGIMVFAFLVRKYREKLVDRHIRKKRAAHTSQTKGKVDD